MSDNLPVKSDVSPVRAVTKYPWEDQLDLLKRTVAAGLTDDEFSLFCYQAKRTGLDPLSRQIYAVKRKAFNQDTGQWEEKMVIQTGIDGFRLVGDRSSSYAPGKAPTYTFKKDGSLESATAYLHKIVGGHVFEVSAMAHFDEYAQKKKDGSLTRFWRVMPRVMLSKCAEALALRRAFPAELSGVYTPEEMSQAEEPTEENNGEGAAATPPQEVGGGGGTPIAPPAPRARKKREITPPQSPQESEQSFRRWAENIPKKGDVAFFEEQLKATPGNDAHHAVCGLLAALTSSFKDASNLLSQAATFTAGDGKVIKGPYTLETRKGPMSDKWAWGAARRLRDMFKDKEGDAAREAEDKINAAKEADNPFNGPSDADDSVVGQCPPTASELRGGGAF